MKNNKWLFDVKRFRNILDQEITRDGEIEPLGYERICDFIQSEIKRNIVAEGTEGK